MREVQCDVAVIGAGPAGMAAAVSARQNGAGNVVVIERDETFGGILQQCVHPGFGLEFFGEELTGPEYAQRFIDRLEASDIRVFFSTMALELREKTIVCSNREGMVAIKAGAIVLAMGCRERTRGNLAIPGSRPAGVYTAGTAQRLLNIHGQMVGRRIVILGSGDIGMIMARRMTLEGAKVEAVVEIMPYLAGLTRNRVQCLDDFGIPLLLSHTVTDIHGVDRVESVTICPVDNDRQPIREQARVIACDTLLLSVGLIPENELSKSAGLALSTVTRGAAVNQYMQTELPYLFACGNVLHVNDLVDNVSREGEAGGKSAALYARGKLEAGASAPVLPGDNVRYVCPQRIALDGGEADLFFRVAAPMQNAEIIVEAGGKRLASKRAIAVNPGEMERITVKDLNPAAAARGIAVHVTGREGQ